MAGHRSFDALREGMSPERRQRNAEATTALLEEMAVREPLKVRRTSQEDLDVDVPAERKDRI